MSTDHRYRESHLTAPIEQPEWFGRKGPRFYLVGLRATAAGHRESKMPGRVRRLCQRCCACCASKDTPYCDPIEIEPLTHEDSEAHPPMAKRHPSLWRRWQRARKRVLQLVRLEHDVLDEDDPLPRCLLEYEQRLELLPLLPPVLRQKRWRLLFTTEDHGCSIKTLLERSAGRGPTVVLVRDRKRHVFGAFAAEAWRREPEPHFYSNGEAFLFSTWPAEAGFRAWRWSGANRFFQAAAVDFVAFGSGGHFGLWVGRSIGTGSTAACATFENEPLTEHSVAGGLEEPAMGDSAFEILELQVWGFT